jgi:hypothetical protein
MWMFNNGNRSGGDQSALRDRLAILFVDLAGHTGLRVVYQRAMKL